MEKDLKKLIQILTDKNKTISVMESCTGGGLANSITNIDGSSDVLKFSAVTYSNEFKIKMGVNKSTIDKFSVYSMEVAREMSKAICDFTNSNYGVGVTGKLNRVDKYNPYGNDNITYICIYDKDNNEYYTINVESIMDKRSENKELIINKIIKELLKII